MTPEIKITPTPWDSRALLIDTYELHIPEISPDGVDVAKNHLLQLTAVKKPSLFYCRVNSNSSSQIKLLHLSGFLNCETQLHVFKNSLHKYTAPIEIGKKRLKIKNATPDDYLEVASLAKSVFNYSRFHEDPFLDKKLVNKRMGMWAVDMFTQGIPLIVSRNVAGGLDAFLFYRIDQGGKVELILGGCLPDKGFLAPFFWASFIEFFIDKGYKKIETKISASNIVIVNIYITFGFSVKETLLDFHKHVC
jgi:hypothetical protein